MDVDEQLKKAWEAVKNSGVPESLQEVAFREAMETLRGGSSPGTVGGGGQERGRATRGRAPGRTGRRQSEPAQEAAAPVPEEGTFFSQLAKESGVEERDLRDILQLKNDGAVHITQPTKDLGTSVAQQARTVIALVAGARARGIGENPVRTDAVRKELERKHCYQPNNFASKHLEPLRGFNAGSTPTEIVLTSKWVNEFKAAIDQAHGRTAANEE